MEICTTDSLGHKCALITPSNLRKLPFFHCIINDHIGRNIEHTLAESLKSDNGTGCVIPKLDPFHPEIMKFDKKLPQIVCTKEAWVRCYVRFLYNYYI